MTSRYGSFQRLPVLSGERPTASSRFKRLDVLRVQKTAAARPGEMEQAQCASDLATESELVTIIGRYADAPPDSQLALLTVRAAVG
jgi:hypothetical protein